MVLPQARPDGPASPFAAVVYQGLTRRDPVLWLPQAVSKPAHLLQPLYSDSVPARARRPRGWRELPRTGSGGFSDSEPRRTLTPVTLEDAICEVVQRHGFGDAVIYLYGSQAKGGARPGSDVDLGVLAGAPVPPLQLQLLREELELALCRDVDLLDLLRASTVLQKEIVTTGRVLREPQPVRRGPSRPSCWAAMRG